MAWRLKGNMCIVIELDKISIFVMISRFQKDKWEYDNYHRTQKLSYNQR